MHGLDTSNVSSRVESSRVEPSGIWALRVLNILSHLRYLKQSLHMRRVTWPLTGGKNSSHFWNPWPQFTYSLCHFQGTTTKIKPRYRQKIAFSHYEGYKVYCACEVSRDLCRGGHPKPHVTTFWPRIAYSLYDFYGATMTIKGSLYWSIPMLKRFSVAKTILLCALKLTRDLANFVCRT